MNYSEKRYKVICQIQQLLKFYDFILECLYSGKSKSKIVKSVYAKGYTDSKNNVFVYLVKMEQREGKLRTSAIYQNTDRSI